MSEFKGTKVPWGIKQAIKSAEIAITAAELCADGKPAILAECVTDIRTANEHANAECLANAKLIASAPELFQALQDIIEMNITYCVDKYGDASQAESMACVRTARAAITRATT